MANAAYAAARLQQAIAKVQRIPRAASPVVAPMADNEPAIVIQERGRTVRVPMAEVLYLKAELKYVTLRTLTGEHLAAYVGVSAGI